jgi:hypothetical protein
MYQMEGEISGSCSALATGTDMMRKNTPSARSASIRGSPRMSDWSIISLLLGDGRPCSERLI